MNRDLTKPKFARLMSSWSGWPNILASLTNLRII
jgi:hypothetical protein